MFGKFLCAIFGHTYANSDTKTYNLSIGKLGRASVVQSMCTRCGHIHTYTTFDGDITYDNFLKACRKTVDDAVTNVIHTPSTDNNNIPAITNGKVRKAGKAPCSTE